MKQTPVKLGPLALLLTVISICLTVMAILTFVTARADGKLADKYAETVTQRYALEAQGQAFLRELDEGVGVIGLATTTDGAYVKVLKLDDARLEIHVRREGSGWKVEQWRIVKEWSEDTDIGHLWPGN